MPGSTYPDGPPRIPHTISFGPPIESSQGTCVDIVASTADHGDPEISPRPLYHAIPGTYLHKDDVAAWLITRGGRENDAAAMEALGAAAESIRMGLY